MREREGGDAQPKFGDASRPGCCRLLFGARCGRLVMEEFDATGRCHGKSMSSWEHSASVGPEALRKQERRSERSWCDMVCASKNFPEAPTARTQRGSPEFEEMGPRTRTARSLILLIALAQPWCWLPPSLPGIARAGEDLKHLLPVMGARLGAGPGAAGVNPKFAVWGAAVLFALARFAIRRKKLPQGKRPVATHSHPSPAKLRKVSGKSSSSGETGNTRTAEALLEDAFEILGNRPDFSKMALQVVFVGGFSAGKSTMINALLQKRQCETAGGPKTQKVESYTGPDGVTYVDTPGLGAPEYPEHRAATCKKVREADVVVLAVNATHLMNDNDISLLKEMQIPRENLVVAVNFWQVHASHPEAQKECRSRIQEMLKNTLQETEPVVKVVYMDAYAAERHFVDGAEDLDTDTAAAFADLWTRTAPVYQKLQWLRKKIADLREPESELKSEMSEVEDEILGGADGGVCGAVCGAAVGALFGPAGAGVFSTMGTMVGVFIQRAVATIKKDNRLRDLSEGLMKLQAKIAELKKIADEVDRLLNSSNGSE
ncbi:unnamed protein product [Effrenium voratum]|uniref:G domain-containing protein n=1 Tax=Effrenium voratum TaxID=2562239 RepID=A0AA36IQQ3_9DINO|nr:unnamed protein product [Effrenium voratum]